MPLLSILLLCHTSGQIVFQVLASPWEKLREEIISGVCVTSMLNECFSGGYPYLLSPPSGQAAHGLKVFIHPVIFAEPLPLTFMTGEHFRLLIEICRNVNVRCRFNGVPIWVQTLWRITVIQVRYPSILFERKSGRIGRSMEKTGGPGEDRCRFVVHHVVA